MARVWFEAMTDGEYCDEKCPRLRGTTDGVPAFVRKAYPSQRIYHCQFFGQLSEQQDGGGFKMQRPKRTKECLEGYDVKKWKM